MEGKRNGRQRSNTGNPAAFWAVSTCTPRYRGLVHCVCNKTNKSYLPCLWALASLAVYIHAWDAWLKAHSPEGPEPEPMRLLDGAEYRRSQPTLNQSPHLCSFKVPLLVSVTQHLTKIEALSGEQSFTNWRKNKQQKMVITETFYCLLL